MHGRGRAANAGPNRLTVHQPVLRVCRVDAIPVLTIVSLDADSRLVIHQLLDLQRVVCRTLRFQVRITKLSEQLKEVRELRILAERGSHLRIC